MNTRRKGERIFVESLTLVGPCMGMKVCLFNESTTLEYAMKYDGVNILKFIYEFNFRSFRRTNKCLGKVKGCVRDMYLRIIITCW